MDSVAARTQSEIEAERLRNSLLATLSHDLRAPITRMQVRADLLPDESNRSGFLRDAESLRVRLRAAELSEAHDALNAKINEINALNARLLEASNSGQMLQQRLEESYAERALLNDAMQERVAILAALLHHRRAIDTELSGPRLARLAQAAGESLFDAACEVEVELRGGPAVLPAPDALVADARNDQHLIIAQLTALLHELHNIVFGAVYFVLASPV